MPKLTRDLAQKASGEAEKLDENGFPKLDDGFYLFTLEQVKTSVSDAGNNVWTWVFVETHSDIKMFYSTVASEKNIGRLGKVFEAFGVPADTDTDELLGKMVAGTVGQGKDKDGNPRQNLKSVVHASQHPEYKGGGRPVAPSDYGLSDGPTTTKAANIDEEVF